MPLDGDLDAPLGVPSDRPVLEPHLQVVLREVEHVRSPVVLVGHPSLEVLLQVAELEEEVRARHELRGGIARLASGIHQLVRVEELAAMLGSCTDSPMLESARELLNWAREGEKESIVAKA